MKKTYYPQIDETIYYETLDNGLFVCLLPKNDFTLTCGVYATSFGNLDCNGKIQVNGKYEKMQSGMAHFLEHRLFDNKKGNVIDLFADLGASCNALTSYNKTAYYFTTSRNVNECVEILLDFVSELNVTKEIIEKEKDIIIQELLMYQDNPDIVLTTNILKNAYHYDMIRDDIGGDTNTVKATTLELLLSAHKTFYHPSNMIFVLIGNFDPTKMMQNIRHNQNKKMTAKPLKYQKFKKIEPREVVKEFESINMDVAFDKVAILYKLPKVRVNVTSKKLELKALHGQVVLDAMFSSSGEVNQYLIEEGVIPRSVNASYINEFRTSNFVLITADVLDVDRFIKIVTTAMDDFEKYLTKGKVENSKKALMGRFITSLNNTERIGVEVANDYFKGLDYLDKPDIIEEISFNGAKKMGEKFKKAPRTVYVIKKNEQGSESSD